MDRGCKFAFLPSPMIEQLLTKKDLRNHFEPWRVVSEKISRDEKTGVSKEVGFARYHITPFTLLVHSQLTIASYSTGLKIAKLPRRF